MMCGPPQAALPDPPEDDLRHNGDCLSMQTSAPDPFEFELFRNALLSVADEMALTVHRTTYSSVLRDNLDYSTGFFDAQGRMIAQGFSLPGHLGSMPTALAAVMQRFGDGIRPGDVFALNDPFDGGMHLPDIFIFQPIFIDGALAAFSGAISHHTDVGGRVAGSNAPDSTEIYQEGVRIPPMRIYDGGRRNDTFFELIRANVRVPDKVAGDLRAQLAACHVAEIAYTDLCRAYGAGRVRQLTDAMLDHSERLARAEIAKLPDGSFTFEDWIDDDGIETGKPILLKVVIDKQGEAIRFDWTGSSPQVKGALNATLSFTKIRLLLRLAVGDGEQRSEQRRDFPCRRGDRPCGQHRELRPARGDRGARPHGVSHGRRGVWRLRADGAGQGVRRF